MSDRVSEIRARWDDDARFAQYGSGNSGRANLFRTAKQDVRDLLAALDAQPQGGPRGDGLDRIEKAVADASEERYQSLREWRQLAEQWKSEGDMSGWNFHQGMAAGANWVDIYYRRITREIEAIRTEAAATSSPTPAESVADQRPRKLTLPELNHLSGLLGARRESGDYAGPREQYYARTERLIKWCDEQIKEK